MSSIDYTASFDRPFDFIADDSQPETMNSQDSEITFDNVIGFNAAKDYLNLCIKSAKMRGLPLEHVLISGPGYIDKSSFASAIVGEMGTNSRTLFASDILNGPDLVGILTNFNNGDFLIIEELEKLKPDLFPTLIKAMSFSVDIIVGKGPSANSIRLDLPQITLIGTVTHFVKIPLELRQQFEISVALTRLTTDEAVLLLKNESRNYDKKLDENALIMIAQKSRGNPKVACRILRRVYDYALVNEENTVTAETVERVIIMMEKAKPSFSSLRGSDKKRV